MDTKTIIYNIRKNHNLTQKEMAEKLFVTRQAVSRWERGETKPNIDTLRLISRVFDISINAIVDEKNLTDLNNDKINADRFLGFAEIYENNRPTVPKKACEFILNYLERTPKQIVDLGCGTGLSTLAWKNKCDNIIGIEPSLDMLSIAKEKSTSKIHFKRAYANNTGLSDNCADIVVCSQSFHWMNPVDTLSEINRILKPGGIFATIDCDWPPVCNWRAEVAYDILLNKIRIIEEENPSIYKTFHRWNKSKHLENIRESGYFKYFREIIFDSKEICSAERFIGIALSQGGLQTILKTEPELIENDIRHFENTINQIYKDRKFNINFCYRMRIGIK